MSTLLFTGFPGFLGSELLPRVLERDPETRALCVVQDRFLDLARERAAAIEERVPAVAGRIELASGDITRPGLGIEGLAEREKEITGIFHLAAVYDLGVSRRVGMAVNVDGTRNVLDVAAACPKLERLDYVSTCYVSGRWAGIFTERDLARGQKFNNYYEETKYLAELEVQHAMAGGLPATIYRPAIVVGDSKTGATQKYDGPYFVIQWVLRQLRLGVVPVVGDPTAVRVNLVPRDFVIDAISYLSGLEAARGKVYQLADPEPLTVSELLDVIEASTRRLLVRLPMMAGPSKLAIRYLPGVYKLLKIPAEAIDYFVHPTHYTCDNTLADLEGTGIRVPPFPDYADRLIEFCRAHPEIGAEAMA